MPKARVELFRTGIVLAVVLCATGTVAAQDATVPPANGIEPERIWPPPTEAAASPGAPSACQLRLAKLAEFQPLPAITGPGECGAVDVVLLQNVILPDRAIVVIAPPATLRCTMAEEVAYWLREDVAPTALKLGAPLRGLEEAGSYECRGFNRVGGATLSEHGRANALDVRSLRLANGKVVRLTDISVAKNWRDALRTSACARFTTVLGPGADSYHEEHIHIDLAQRRGGYRLCQWDVREPIAQAEKTDQKSTRIAAKITEPVPLPHPRPSAANHRARPHRWVRIPRWRLHADRGPWSRRSEGR